jgi:phosphatidylserine decarboxylase
LVKQIVGPVARRVVYWVEPGQIIKKGEPIGMMKFGSRLDMYFPRDDVDVVVKKGDKVRAGETVVARLKQ